MSISGHKVSLAFCAMIALACRSERGGLTESQKLAVRDSARSVVREVFDRANKLDFAGAFQAYSDDPDARYAESGFLYPSVDSLRKTYATLQPTLEMVENTVISWNVLVLGEDVAAMTLPVHLRIKAKGRQPYIGEYVWSGIVQRRAAGWKVVQSHESYLEADKVMAAITSPAEPKSK